MLGKVVFHIIYSILIMIYLFIGIPYTTNTSFGSKDSVVFFTILQMLYIILSSLQISHGFLFRSFLFYPSVILLPTISSTTSSTKTIPSSTAFSSTFPFSFSLISVLSIHPLPLRNPPNSRLGHQQHFAQPDPLAQSLLRPRDSLRFQVSRSLHFFIFSSIRRSITIVIRTNASSESGNPSRKSVSARS